MLQQLYQLWITFVHGKLCLLTVGSSPLELADFLLLSEFAVSGQQQRSKALIDPNEYFFMLSHYKSEPTESLELPSLLRLENTATCCIKLSKHFCFLTGLQALNVEQLHRLCHGELQREEFLLRFLLSRRKLGFEVSLLTRMVNFYVILGEKGCCCHYKINFAPPVLFF